jgi:hypothetical protein
VGALPDGPRLRYLRRKQDFELYFAEASGQAFRVACGLSLKQVYHLLTERCCKVWRVAVRDGAPSVRAEADPAAARRRTTTGFSSGNQPGTTG